MIDKKKKANVLKFIFGVHIEHAVVWDLQKLIFLLILVLLLIKSTANAIFLTMQGVEQLPIAYVLMAFVALVVTSSYNKYIDKMPTVVLFYRSIQLSIVSLLVIGIILYMPAFKGLAAYLFFIFVSIFGIFSASQFWILANSLFDHREARKYFGIIGFGAIGGGVLGGYLVSILTSFLSSEFIPILSAALLLIVLKFIRRIKIEAEFTEVKSKSSSYFFNIKEPIKLITSSKHLTYLALVIALSVFTSKLIDFQFGYFASKAYPLEEDLTQFYGICLSSFNIVAIIIQLFLTTRIVGRFGIGYSLLILPVLLFVNAGFLILLPGLFMVVGLKLSDASFKQSINKAAMELTMLPTPEDIKLKTKTFLDVFVDSIATGISGIILLTVLKVFDLDNWIVTAVIVVSVTLWLYMTNRMRIEYKKVFRQSLNIQSKLSETHGHNIIEHYKTVFREGNPRQILKVLKMLSREPILGLDPYITPLLEHKNVQIVMAGLESLLYVKKDYSQHVTPLLHHTSQNVRILAFEYIINHQDAFEPDYLLMRINHADLEERIIALAAYAKEFKNDPRTLKTLRIEDRIDIILKDPSFGSIIELKIGLLKTIGYGKFNQYYYLIDESLVAQNEVLRKNAILAAGETRSSFYLRKLLTILETEEEHKALQLALSKYGSKRLAVIVRRLTEEGAMGVLHRIPPILELIPEQGSVQLLEQLLDSDDFDVRSSAIKSLRNLNDHYPLLQINHLKINRVLIEETKYASTILKIISKTEHEDFNTQEIAKQKLINILKNKIDINLELIFQLLHLIYPPENYLELYGYVKGDDDTLRNNAIEYVDNSLGNDLKAYIIPLLEYVSTFDFPADVPQIKLSEAKEFLLKNRDPEISGIAKEMFLKR